MTPNPVLAVRRALDALPAPAARGPTLVAVSGGRDSITLLHILRFGADGEPLLPVDALRVVHLDHAMRAGSSGDAAWLRGVSRAWGIRHEEDRLEHPPRSEGEARTRRYAFFREVVTRTRASALLLAHHADDQAETVLFRLLRGTGPRGLAGIPAARSFAGALLLRPLLAVPGAAIEGRAREAHLRVREDPTNRELGHARNRIRHDLLPALEAEAPGTRDLLIDLASEAALREAALEELLSPALNVVVKDRRFDETILHRPALLRLPEALRGELLRALFREGGGSSSRRGIALALDFVVSGGSGRALAPAPGIRIHRDFDDLAIRFVRSRTEPDRSVAATGISIPSAARAGEGRVVLTEVTPGRRRAFKVRWGPVHGTPPASGDGEKVAAGGSTATFPVDRLRFPLEVRGRRPGDRVRRRLRAEAREDEQRGGTTRTLKKLLMEYRISREDRALLPLLVDGDGLVVWIPGVWRSFVPGAGCDGATWFIEVSDA